MKILDKYNPESEIKRNIADIMETQKAIMEWQSKIFSMEKTSEFEIVNYMREYVKEKKEANRMYLEKLKRTVDPEIYQEVLNEHKRKEKEYKQKVD